MATVTRRSEEPASQEATGVEPYRHLEDREEILWGLDFVQLIYVLLGAAIAIVFALYLSPLPTGPSLMIAIVVGGLPVVASLVASNGDLAPWTMTRAAWRWARRPRRYVPGANACAGYNVQVAERYPGNARPAGADAERPALEEVLPL